MNKAPGSSQNQQRDQTSAGPCGAQATLPVDGSMRLPCTRPVVGSVPCGRRKSRMCGSGLRKRDVHGSEASECKPERSGQGEGVARAGLRAPVDGVVHPAAALLHAEAAPLALR